MHVCAAGLIQHCLLGSGAWHLITLESECTYTVHENIFSIMKVVIDVIHTVDDINPALPIIRNIP